jgi:hypothetical protein
VDVEAVTSFWADGHADLWAHTYWEFSAYVDVWWRRLRSRRQVRALADRLQFQTWQSPLPYDKNDRPR